MTSHQFILDFDGERIIGENPFAVFEAKNRESDALNELRQKLKEAKQQHPHGGALGFIAYDFARRLEPRAFGNSPPDDLQIPDIRLTFFYQFKTRKNQASSNKHPATSIQQQTSGNKQLSRFPIAHQKLHRGGRHLSGEFNKAF